MPKYLQFPLALMLLACGLALTGCGPGESIGLTAETDDAGYREGQQLVRQGRPQEALAAYLKVIARRAEAAPESHLEAGLIYKQHIKDPIAAIYHFRKFLEQQPNARQAPLVRQQIVDAKREFGRSLPNQPLESREVRIDGFDQRDRLERENEQLRNELSVLRAGGGSVGMLPAGRVPVADNREVQAAVAVEASPSTITLAPIQPAEPEPVAPAPAVTGTRAKPAAPAAAGGRRHIVAPKDSLYAIAKKYYGTATNARVQAIIQANRQVLPADNALQPGMELKIP
jgi:tetratricopeptide (TPR) repeat protein